MNTLENLYHINNNKVKSQRAERILKLQKKAEKARKLRDQALHKRYDFDNDENLNNLLSDNNYFNRLNNVNEYNHYSDEDEDNDETSSEDDEYSNIDNLIIIPSTKNWYTYGYEHIIRSINGTMKVFDLDMIEADIESFILKTKNVYFLRRIPDIVIKNRHLECFQNVNLILIPGTDGFASYDFNITEVICVNNDIYKWAIEIFQNNVKIVKHFNKEKLILNPRRFSEHQVLFLHIMDGFISQTDVVLNAWLDQRIKYMNTHPQLLILAEFSQFYQIFQIFRHQLQPINGGRTPHIEFKEFFKVKNRNIYISFYNYSYPELELISKSVSFMIQPGSSQVKYLAKKWKCGLISQNNQNGFELIPKFIDYDLIFRRRKLELYVSEGDQQFPYKYTTHQQLLIKVRQALHYMKSLKE